MKNSIQATTPLLTAILFLSLFLAPASEAAISCSDVIKDLRPCLSYLTSGSGAPPATCCAGAKTLASAVTSTADKQAACTCIKSAAKNVNVNAALAKALPGNCGINGINVDPNTDCSKIS